MWWWLAREEGDVLAGNWSVQSQEGQPVFWGPEGCLLNRKSALYVQGFNVEEKLKKAYAELAEDLKVATAFHHHPSSV